MSVWAHTLVKNEKRYLWYAVESVIEYVDRLLLWDTGSSDGTIEIIKLLKKKHGDKIDISFWGEVTPEGYTSLRQQMLEKTTSDWVLILDGDEVWFDDGIAQVVKIVNERGDKLDSIVNGYYNLVGDIYHFQDETKGRYKIDGVKGNITIRAFNRKIPGLYTAKPHGQHGYYDKKDVLIQDRASKKRFHLREKTYLHFTHLVRSQTKTFDKKVPKREGKFKYELGSEFPNDFFYPEVFFRARPEGISTPWERASFGYKLIAHAQTPLKLVKQGLIPSKTGY